MCYAFLRNTRAPTKPEPEEAGVKKLAQKGNGLVERQPKSMSQGPSSVWALHPQGSCTSHSTMWSKMSSFQMTAQSFNPCRKQFRETSITGTCLQDPLPYLDGRFISKELLVSWDSFFNLNVFLSFSLCKTPLCAVPMSFQEQGVGQL